MRKNIIMLVVVAVLGVGLFTGLKFYANATRPDLNGNEKIVSTSMDKYGNPIDKLGDADEVNITKDLEEVYLSIPANDKNLTESRVTLSYDGKVIDDTIVEVSQARYVTYHFTDLKNRESGLYQFAFYDDKGAINVYAGLTVE